MKPQRIQRKRTKGWRMPENTIYVGRGSKWGNPWRAGRATALTGPKAGQKATAQDVVGIFRHTIETKLKYDTDLLEPLRGKNLACWCPPEQPCHADVLLKLANREQP